MHTYTHTYMYMYFFFKISLVSTVEARCKLSPWDAAGMIVVWGY